MVSLATILLLEACLAKPQYPYDDPSQDARFFHHKKKKKPLLGGSDCKGRTFVYVYNQITGGGGGHGGGDGLGEEGDGGDGDDGDDGDADGGDYSDTAQNDCGGGGGLLGHGGLLGGLLGSNGGGGTRQSFPLGVRPQRYLRYFYRAVRPFYRFF